MTTNKSVIFGMNLSFFVFSYILKSILNQLIFKEFTMLVASKVSSIKTQRSVFG